MRDTKPFCTALVTQHVSASFQKSTSIKVFDYGTEIYNAHKKYAEILSKAVYDEPLLREFLKNESLKQFDNDYDILHQLVKNVKIGDKTFKQILLKYTSETSLDSIEKVDPLLTILVPTLPNFSPDTWNIVAELPQIAVINTSNGSIHLVDHNNHYVEVAENTVPTKPVLVIKVNERVVLKTNSLKPKTSTSANKPSETFSAGNYNFEFIDSEFDNHTKEKSDAIETQRDFFSRVTNIDFIHRANINAYYAAQVNDQWQRDYVYYGIDENNPNGAFKNNFAEFIKSIKFTEGGFYKISDQTSDPRAMRGPNNSAYWTEGYFELQITVLT